MTWLGLELLLAMRAYRQRDVAFELRNRRANAALGTLSLELEDSGVLFRMRLQFLMRYLIIRISLGLLQITRNPVHVVIGDLRRWISVQPQDR